ncbi:MAG: hypothetical protein ACK56I_36435, partial [bacterium]
TIGTDSSPMADQYSEFKAIPAPVAPIAAINSPNRRFDCDRKQTTAPATRRATPIAKIAR